MAVRLSRAVSVIAGCVALAGIAATPSALAASEQTGPDDRVAVAGSTPAWATPAAKVGDVAASQRRHVQVALALRHQSAAEALAKEISTPGSPQYRKTLTANEFTNRFAATTQTVEHVSQWLRSQGLTRSGPPRRWRPGAE